MKRIFLNGLLLSISLVLICTAAALAQPATFHFDFPHGTACSNCHTSHHSGDRTLVALISTPEDADDTRFNQLCTSCISMLTMATGLFSARHVTEALMTSGSTGHTNRQKDFWKQAHLRT
jgi:hypothetical protein